MVLKIKDQSIIPCGNFIEVDELSAAVSLHDSHPGVVLILDHLDYRIE